MTSHADLLDSLRQAKRVLLTGPVGPDGDSIGACLGLQRILSHFGIPSDVAGEPGYRYAWMPGADGMIPDEDLSDEYDVVVILDGDRHRLTAKAEAAFSNGSVRGIIDHHASTTPDGYTTSWIEPHATSTCEMLYSVLGDWGVELDKELATLLYVGAIFDTGGFRYSNTKPATHQMAAHLLEVGIDHASICARILMDRGASGIRLAGRIFSECVFYLDGALVVGDLSLELAADLGVLTGDLEGLVDTLVHTRGVEVAVLLIQRGPNTVKYSLRSRGRVGVAAVAKSLSDAGGGHRKAAGASIQASMDESRQRVIEAVSRVLSGRTGTNG